MLHSASNAFVLHELIKIQPEIPLLGFDDIPIRDEIEFEMIL